MSQGMLTISDLVKQYFQHQIEIYGDELALAKKHLLGLSLESDRGEAETLDDFLEKIKDCQKCPLGKTRQHFVFGEGFKQAQIMLIGEAPGGDEDRLGRPFVGAAGQLLDKILNAINLDRNQVYIANIIKCRPPNNREPSADEVARCRPYLLRQIELIRPKLILALGRIAAQSLLNTTQTIGSLRGHIYECYHARLIPTYHPAALLRDASLKPATWEDVKLLRRLYDEIQVQNKK